MLETLLGLAAFAGVLLAVPVTPPLDPGPAPECPDDMRLVTGTHYDVMQHYCVNPDEDKKDTHCYSYWPGLSAEEGPVKEINVCMDMYEAPNKRGQKPYVMKSYKMAKSWCEKRSRRMCSEEEWETACEGPDKRPLAYGWSVDKKLCNSDKQWQAFDAKKLNDPDDDVVKAFGDVKVVTDPTSASMLKGATLTDLVPQVSALGAFAVTVFTVAALRFRKQLG